MPPFRVVARHPDPKHHDHAPAQVGGTFDTHDDAIDELVDAGAEPNTTPAPLDPDARVRITAPDRAAELRAQGYELKVQELVPTKHGEDDAGGTVATNHKWKDV